MIQGARFSLARLSSTGLDAAAAERQLASPPCWTCLMVSRNVWGLLWDVLSHDLGLVPGYIKRRWRVGRKTAKTLKTATSSAQEWGFRTSAKFPGRHQIPWEAPNYIGSAKFPGGAPNSLGSAKFLRRRLIPAEAPSSLGGAEFPARRRIPSGTTNSVKRTYVKAARPPNDMKQETFKGISLDLT